MTTQVNGPSNQPDYSFDKRRVSPDVQKQVGEIAAKDGKKGISSAQERAELEQLSQQLAQTGNKHEQNYVMGLMVEYDAKAAEAERGAAKKKQKQQVTPHAREILNKLKKMLPGKNELNESEARLLLNEIKNTNGDYNAADIEFFKQELIKAGFGDLLEELESSGQPNDSQTPEPEAPQTPEPEAPQTPEPEEPQTPEPEEPQTPPEPPKTKEPEAPQAPGPEHQTEVPKNPKNRNSKGRTNPFIPNDPIKKQDQTKPLNPKEGTSKKGTTPSHSGLRFKNEDVANRAHLIVNASEGWGTDEEMFIDNVTVGSKRDKSGNSVADKHLHGRQPFNAAEAKAIDKQLRDMTGKGLLQYMSEEFDIDGSGANNQFIAQLYRQYITYGLKDN